MKISLELNRARIGTVVEALVDGADEEFLFCRSYAEAADVDGIIKVPHCGNPVPAGSYVSIKITGADYYDLCGELVPPLKTGYTVSRHRPLNTVMQGVGIAL